jgi:hypothetical protein
MFYLKEGARAYTLMRKGLQDYSIALECPFNKLVCDSKCALFECELGKNGTAKVYQRCASTQLMGLEVKCGKKK